MDETQTTTLELWLIEKSKHRQYFRALGEGNEHLKPVSAIDLLGRLVSEHLAILNGPYELSDNGDTATYVGAESVLHERVPERWHVLQAAKPPLRLTDTTDLESAFNPKTNLKLIREALNRIADALDERNRIEHRNQR